MSLVLTRRPGDAILITNRENRALIRIRFLSKGEGSIKLAFDGGVEDGLSVVREEIHPRAWARNNTPDVSAGSSASLGAEPSPANERGASTRH